MTDLTGRKPILCLDFDGVCHSYVSGWKGAAVIPDPPVMGMWEFLAAALHEFEVDIFSSRSNQVGGILAMKDWFEQHCPEWAKWTLKELKFPTEKPPALVGIDDRVLTFTGTWPNIDALRNFEPWNAKGV
jgi:hypothetical protein